MKPIELISQCKINLCLDVMGKDHNAGKHFLNTILYRLETPSDRMTLEQTARPENHLSCSVNTIPTDASNTILKVLELLGEKGWSIHLEKDIPSQAGLGGGSGNAGALLKYFGERKGIPEDHLLDLARTIGADVPFFVLEDNLAYAEGYGDQIVQSWTIPPLSLSLMETGVLTSTADAYAALDLEECAQDSVKTEALLQLLNTGENISVESLIPFIHNDFERLFFQKNPDWKGQGHLCGSGGMLWSFG